MTDFRTALDALSSEDMVRRVRTLGLDELRQLCLDHGLTPAQGVREALAQGVVPRPFLKNLHTLSISEQERLMGSTVLLAGAGGLGGYVLELLTRFGVGRIMVADGDGFEDLLLISLFPGGEENIISVTVFNDRGYPVRRLAERVAAGPGTSLTWDGLSDLGGRLPAGLYIIMAESYNSTGASGRWKEVCAVLYR